MAQGINVALRSGDLRDNGLIARRLTNNPRDLYAASRYLARKGTPATMSDLRGHQCLAVVGSTHWTFEREGRLVRQAIGGRFMADSVDALLQAAVEGGHRSAVGVERP